MINRSYEFKKKFGSEGAGQGEFYYPFGVAINEKNGRIHVLECENNRVQVFDSNLNFLMMIGFTFIHFICLIFD